MRPIKFRGKSKFNGEIVFGDLTHSRTGKAIYIEDDQVEPESVAQLVGYDADDNEVYDDDILIDEDGVEWEINQIPQIEMTIGGVLDYLYNPKYKFRLKK